MNLNRSEPLQAQPVVKKYGVIVLSVVLWVIVAVLAMFCIFALRELFVWAVAALLSEPGNQARRAQVANIINFTQQCVVIILGVLGLGVVMATVEYLFRHAGKAQLNRTLLIVIALESALVLPVALIFWL
jgi:hypothetical protein